MDVHTLWHLRVGFSSNRPAGVVKLVATVVSSDDVHKQDVFCAFVQPIHMHLEWWKHPPVIDNEWGKSVNLKHISPMSQLQDS